MNTQPSHGNDNLIACIGLEWRTEVSLRAVLDVIRDKTVVPWHHTEDSTAAQVILYDPSNALAQAMLRRTKGSAERIMVPCGTSSTAEEDYLHLPIGATHLLSLLDRICERLENLGAPVLAQVPLSQGLDEALHRKDVLGIAITCGQLAGFIAPRQKAIYWPKPLDADQIAAMLLDSPKILPFTTSDTAMARRFLQHAADMVGWDPLMWSIGSGSVTGRLSRHLDPQQAYQVNRWPDFGPIGRKSADIKFVSLLSQRACTPVALGEMPGFTPARAAKYLNASLLCGILEPAQDLSPEREEAAAAPANPFLSSLLRGLRRAFALEGH